MKINTPKFGSSRCWWPEIKLAKTDIKIMENAVNENCMAGGRDSKTLTERMLEGC